MTLSYSGYLQRSTGGLLLYYITDRRQFPGNAEEQRRLLLDKIGECVAEGVDYIQLREKDLTIHALEELAAEAMKLVTASGRTRLLINSRTDVALACGAHGVHLPASDLSASEARTIFGRTGNVRPVIAVSTHSSTELSYAEAHGADFAVFGPVFEKNGATAGEGLQRLTQVCHEPNRAMPVLAIGGVTLENAGKCLAAGANGIAAIRLFQDAKVAKTVRLLREQLL